MSVADQTPADLNLNTSSPTAGAQMTYSEAALNVSKAIPIEELKIIKANLNKVSLTEELGEIQSADPEISSKVIPYYRNLKHRIFSVFNEVPEEFELLQDFNMYLINEVHLARLVRINWPKPGLKTDLKFVKSGKTDELTKVIHELIFLLRIKEGIDYENSTYRGFSSIINWLIKTINYFKSDNLNKVIHVVLTPRDHEFLAKELKTEGDTLAYRLFQQTINLLVLIASQPLAGPVGQQLKVILSGKEKGITIKRNIADLSNVEPYYIWNSILDPEERGLLTQKVKKNFFAVQNQLLRKFRSASPENAVEELHKLKQEVDNALPSGVKAVIYGRLKLYRNYLKEPEAKNLIANRKGNNQLTDQEVRRIANRHKEISLFDKCNVAATVSGLYNKPTEIIDLTSNALLDPASGKIIYYTQDLESSVTYKILLEKEQAEQLNPKENLLLSMIKSQSIQFVPGIHRRY